MKKQNDEEKCSKCGRRKPLLRIDFGPRYFYDE
jgi:hypothetical protein